MTALFDNGTQKDIFQIPIAMFPNVNGLGNRTGNAYIATDLSGDFNLLMNMGMAVSASGMDMDIEQTMEMSGTMNESATFE